MNNLQAQAETCARISVNRNYSDRLNQEISNLEERLAKLKTMQSMMQNNPELKGFINTMAEIGYL